MLYEKRYKIRFCLILLPIAFTLLVIYLLKRRCISIELFPNFLLLSLLLALEKRFTFRLLLEIFLMLPSSQIYFGDMRFKICKGIKFFLPLLKRLFLIFFIYERIIKRWRILNDYDGIKCNSRKSWIESYWLVMLLLSEVSV